MPDERRSSENMQLLQQKYVSKGRLARLTTGRFKSALASLLDEVTAPRVFDAGCGEGWILAELLEPRFASVFGADLDMERLRYAREQQQAQAVLQCNLQHIPLADNAVDLVLCLEVLEHVGNPQQSLAELHRVTGRYAILSVPNEPFWRMANMARGAYWSAWGNTPEHINHWSVWGFQRFVAPLFRVMRVLNPAGVWTMLLVEKKPTN
jgi:2-polyprenyl-3-methyl-5-hydroxy-6-metoxy-1,4-benzoquinol methylase